MKINIQGKILTRSQIDALLENSNGILKESIKLAFFEGLKLNKIVERTNINRRTLQYQLNSLGTKILGEPITFEMIRWGCMIDLFNKGYAAEYISNKLGYSNKGEYLKYKRKVAGYVPNDLRLKVFSRDNFRCVLCGSQDNLQVDHIISISNNGKSTLNNLRTLCQKCNLGRIKVNA